MECNDKHIYKYISKQRHVSSVFCSSYTANTAYACGVLVVFAYGTITNPKHLLFWLVSEGEKRIFVNKSAQLLLTTTEKIKFMFMFNVRF